VFVKSLRTRRWRVHFAKSPAKEGLSLHCTENIHRVFHKSCGNLSLKFLSPENASQLVFGFWPLAFGL
jgi:hypothetical protein